MSSSLLSFAFARAPRVEDDARRSQGQMTPSLRYDRQTIGSRQPRKEFGRGRADAGQSGTKQDTIYIDSSSC